MSNNTEALIAEAKLSASIMELIASFEPQDIDGDDIDLRFEVDGFDTGCDVSLVEQCGKASVQLSALIAALEQSQALATQQGNIACALLDEVTSLRPTADDKAKDKAPAAFLAIYHGDVYDEAIGITRSVVEAQAERFGWELALTEIVPLYAEAQRVAAASPLAVKLPAVHDDTRRMDWLCSMVVDVREPLVYGSHSIFWSQCDSADDEPHHTTLREQIDVAIAAAPKPEV